MTWSEARIAAGAGLRGEQQGDLITVHNPLTALQAQSCSTLLWGTCAFPCGHAVIIAKQFYAAAAKLCLQQSLSPHGDRQQYWTDYIRHLHTGASTSGSEAGGESQNLLQMLWPADATDRRMFACVAAVRSLLVPGSTLLLVRGLAALRWLPDDPVCTLCVLIQVRAS